MHPVKTRPSAALLVAVIALVAALAGSASALPGKKTIDKNDFKKGAVTKKAIKAGAVTTKGVKDANIGAVDLVPDEPFHRVGGSGEPAFGNGGENDCIWSNVGALLGPGTTVNSGAFYIDKGGVVRLAGVVRSTNGPGGDGACNEGDDFRVYTLPPAYRPENIEVIPLNEGSTTELLALIVGDEDLVSGPTTIAAGGVLISASGENTATFDGVSFRAAGPGDNGLTPTSANANRISPSTLKELGIDLGG